MTGLMRDSMDSELARFNQVDLDQILSQIIKLEVCACL